MFVEFFPLLIKEMGGSPEDFARKLLEDYHFTMFVIGEDYSMHEYGLKNNLKISSADELMNICKGEPDHVNLFLTKGGNDEELF